MTETNTPEFREWAILELMGHIKLAGIVTECEMFGAKLGRIEIPIDQATFVTQFFGGGSVYRLTPTTEQIARAVAISNQPQPVHRWELNQPALPSPHENDNEEAEYDE
jgi:hypothetical protein